MLIFLLNVFNYFLSGWKISAHLCEGVKLISVCEK